MTQKLKVDPSLLQTFLVHNNGMVVAIGGLVVGWGLWMVIIYLL